MTRPYPLVYVLPILVAALIVGIRATMSWKSSLLLQQSAGGIADSREISSHVINVQFALAEMERTEHAYQLTGEIRLLPDYREAHGRAEEHLNKLAALFPAGSTSAESVIQIRQKVRQAAEEMEETARTPSVDNARRALLESLEHEHLAGAIDAVGNLHLASWKAFSSNIENLHAQIARSFRTQVAVGLIGGVCIAGLLVLVSREYRKRRQIEAIQTRFFDLAPELFCVVGFDGNFKYINPAFSKMLGFSEAEILAKPVFDLVPPERVETCKATLKKLTEGRNLSNYECQFRCRDHSIRWLSWTFLLFAREGNIFCSARDVTDMKVVRDALQDSENRLQRVVEGSQLGYWDVHWPTGNAVFNGRWEEMLGFQPNELPRNYDTWEKLIHPEDRKSSVEAWNALVEGDLQTLELDHRFRTKQGNWHWVHTRGSVVSHTVEGRPEHISGTQRCIQHRKEAAAIVEREFEETLRFQEALFNVREHEKDTIPDFLRVATEECARALSVERASIWRLDEAGLALVCQDLFLRSSQQHESGQEIPPTSCPLLFAALAERKSLRADDALAHPAVIEFTQQRLEPGEEISSFLGIPAHLGGRMEGVLFCEHTGSTRNWTDREVDFAMSVAQSILLVLENDLRRHAETQLRDLNASLEQTVIERTTALTVAGEALRDAELKQMMREALQRREIATELHDLVGQDLVACRFKLGRIRQEFSAESTTATMMGESCQLLDQAIQSARSLVFDLSPPMLHEIGLGSTLEWLAERYSQTYGLNVRVHQIGPVDPLPETVRVLFFQAAREFLVNVVKHADATEVKVICSRPSGRLLLSVEDNGGGFLPIIKTTASGFGLKNIRDRFQHLGGTLDICTTPNGSVLQVSIPLATPPDP